MMTKVDRCVPEVPEVPEVHGPVGTSDGSAE